MSKKPKTRVVVRDGVILFRLLPRRLELGVDYRIKTTYRFRTPNVMGHKCRHLVCRFVKVTPKGFNLLDLETSKCILKQHLYDSKWTGKDIPPEETKFQVWVPDWVEIQGRLPQSDVG